MPLLLLLQTWKWVFFQPTHLALYTLPPQTKLTASSTILKHQEHQRFLSHSPQDRHLWVHGSGDLQWAGKWTRSFEKTAWAGESHRKSQSEQRGFSILQHPSGDTVLARSQQENRTIFLVVPTLWPIFPVNEYKLDQDNANYSSTQCSCSVQQIKQLLFSFRYFS